MRHLLKTPDNRRKFLIFIGDVLLIAAAILVMLFLYSFLKEHYTLKILKTHFHFSFIGSFFLIPYYVRIGKSIKDK